MPSRSSDVRANLVKYASFILNQRPYFRHKLREKLVSRCKKLDFTDYTSCIDSILNDLQASGYLDDSYLAAAFVRRQLSKGYGPKLISYKLSRLGLSTDTVKTVLEIEAPMDKQLEAARSYLKKLSGKDKFKQISALYRRGFGSMLAQRLFDVETFES